MSGALLQLKNICKDFSGTTVLEDVSFSLNEGEILGLVGENGAGKSTLMSILFGMPHITESGGYGGEVKLNDKVVNLKSPFDALENGIGMVHQEFSLIPGFTASENILLNREITSPNFMVNIFGHRMEVLNKARMNERAEKAIQRLNVSIDPKTVISEMPVGHKQFTEIAREIDRDNVKDLVLDEPTAVLTEQEADVLLKTIKELASTGIAIIFISHRLREIIEVCDKVVILRDGKVVKDVPKIETNISDIASSMVGRSVKEKVDSQKNDKLANAKDVFVVENLWVDMPGENVRDVSFSVKEGEIFGIAGLAGQGKLGIPNGIMGLFPSGGKIVFEGKELSLNNPALMLKEGLASVSEDRRGVGLLLDESLDWNISFSAMQSKNMFLKSYGFFKLRDEKAMQENAKKYIDSGAPGRNRYRSPAWTRAPGSKSARRTGCI
ncbi:MAG: sugar ABC transporter ATP-binding protein [Treponema sp.]|nr:sugar ABC transporter ATP-binding protein [Treponema sp.]